MAGKTTIVQRISEIIAEGGNNETALQVLTSFMQAIH